MKVDEVVAEVELRFRNKSVKLKAVVDTGASRSVMSRVLSDELGAFTPLEKPYDLRTADEGERLRIVGYCRVGIRNCFFLA
jgi:predicted aspartyl protease